MIGIVVAAAVVVAGGAAVWLFTRSPSAEDVARQYLTALSAGDVSAVRGLLAEAPADADQIEAAFGGATGFITDFTFEMNDGDSEERRVSADVTLGGDAGVIGFVLAKTDGGWRVASDYLASLEIQQSVGDWATVGGALVPTADALPLLPAVYPVAAAPAGLLVGDAEAVVTNEAPVEVALTTSLSPDAASAAQEQFDAYADACAEPADAVPEHCGLRVPWAADLESLASIAFRIEAYPVVQIADDGTTFAATDGRIVATATGTARGGDPATFTYSADDWSMRGGVEFTGTEMVLAVR